MHELKLTRLIDASPDKVFRCWTDPELIPAWFCPPPWGVSKAEVDLRPGGAYLYGWQHPDGRYFEIGGTYKEITPHSEIKHVERFNGAESQCVLRLVEANGKTAMTLTMDFGSKEVRDAAFATGMATGMERSYQRLDEIAAEAA